MRVADYIFKTLADWGTKHVFLVTGGGAMHLNDALGREKRIKYICNLHEQACAIAAEGYVRATGNPGVVCVTTGPGGTNALTGVIGQWLDSIPVIYISGQVKYETSIMSCPEIGLRQLGDQEINIIDIVKPVTKYAKAVLNPEDIREELEKAMHFAHSGRPGPVWLDIPLDVQGALIEESQLNSYECNEKNKPEIVPEDIENAFELIKNAKRPILVAGFGIRLSGAESEFINLAERLQIPIVTTFNGFDLIPSSHPQFIGRIGTLGTRAGNFALQNADLIITLGSRNNIRQISYTWKYFGRCAKKIVVDIDNKELKKNTVKPDLGICADAKDFIESFNAIIARNAYKVDEDWLSWCVERKMRLPTSMSTPQNQQGIDPYYFMKVVSECSPANVPIVAGNGTACVSMFQAGTVKKDQRIFWNSGCASMGYGLPAALGASAGCGKTVCITGDGSIQMNLQELQTIIHNRLPVKIFVLENHGYSSIRQTQNSFFNGEHIGCDINSGVSFPDMQKLGQVYGFRTTVLDSPNQMEKIIKETLDGDDPAICIVQLNPDYIFSPKLSSKKLPDGRMISKPLEDMFPFLDRDEFKRNMIVPICKEG